VSVLHNNTDVDAVCSDTCFCCLRCCYMRGLCASVSSAFKPTVARTEPDDDMLQDVAIESCHRDLDVRDQGGNPCSLRRLRAGRSLEFLLIWTPSSEGSLDQFIDISSNEAFPDIRIACVGYTDGSISVPHQLSASSPAEPQQEDVSHLANAPATCLLPAGVPHGKDRKRLRFGPPSWDNISPGSKPERLQRVSGRSPSQFRSASVLLHDRSSALPQSPSQRLGAAATSAIPASPSKRRHSLTVLSPVSSNVSAPAKHRRGDNDQLSISPSAIDAPQLRKAPSISKPAKRPIRVRSRAKPDRHPMISPQRPASQSPARQQQQCGQSASLASAAGFGESPATFAPLERSPYHAGFASGFNASKHGSTVVSANSIQSSESCISWSSFSRPSQVSQTRSRSLRSAKSHQAAAVPHTLECTAALAIYHTECVLTQPSAARQHAHAEGHAFGKRTCVHACVDLYTRMLASYQCQHIVCCLTCDRSSCM
jgi:hypothetical protein